ncbi:hypothetical protein V6N12_069134 [Hibiscus sabdariffa]|uniref:Uncharacterized protein n=1 Tax=Hibiscus sabdariffa TaxID=183260 RepID=A0ABR2FD46_9ROSI
MLEALWEHNVMKGIDIDASILKMTDEPLGLTINGQNEAKRQHTPDLNEQTLATRPTTLKNILATNVAE